jgi:hypothetical protein
MDATRKLLANVSAPGDDVAVVEARNMGGIPKAGGHEEERLLGEGEGEGRRRRSTFRWSSSRWYLWVIS